MNKDKSFIMSFLNNYIQDLQVTKGFNGTLKYTVNVKVFDECKQTEGITGDWNSLMEELASIVTLKFLESIKK